MENELQGLAFYLLYSWFLQINTWTQSSMFKRFYLQASSIWTWCAASHVQSRSEFTLLLHCFLIPEANTAAWLLYPGSCGSSLDVILISDKADKDIVESSRGEGFFFFLSELGKQLNLGSSVSFWGWQAGQTSMPKKWKCQIQSYGSKQNGHCWQGSITRLGEPAHWCSYAVQQGFLQEANSRFERADLDRKHSVWNILSTYYPNQVQSLFKVKQQLGDTVMDFLCHIQLGPATSQATMMPE